MRALVITGAALLMISAPPLILMAREVAAGSEVKARYSIEHFTGRPESGGGELRATIGGHEVRLEDDQPFREAGEVRVEGPVRILVAGRDYSSRAPVQIRLEARDANRYWGYVYLKKLVDHQERTEQLVVAQNVGQGRFRTVSVSADGRVVEDQFEYAERCSPPVRGLLIYEVVPYPSGYCSNVLQLYPSFFYPVLYPWISGASGFACLGVAGLLKLRRRDSGGRRELPGPAVRGEAT